MGGFILNTTDPRDTGKSKAFGLLVDYPNDPWSSSFLYREIQENYDAAVGFTPRTGFRRLAPNVQYTVRPPQHPWVRTVVFGLSTPRSRWTRSTTLCSIAISTRRSSR